MTFQQLVGHRQLARHAGARGRARLAAAGADLRRAGGRREVRRRRRAGAGAELRVARGGAPAAAVDVDACGTLPHVPSGSQRALERCAGAGPSALDCVLVLAPGRQGLDQGRPDPGGHRPHAATGRSTAGGASSIIDEADALEVGAAERAAEGARGAAALDGVRAGDRRGPTRCSPRSGRGARGCGSGCCRPTRSTDGARARPRPGPERGASRGRAGWRQPRGRRSGGSTATGSDVRGRGAGGAVAGAARGESPASRLAAGQDRWSRSRPTSGRKKGGDGVSRAVLAERLEALGALLRDVASVVVPRGCPLAGIRRPGRRRGGAGRRVRRRPGGPRVCRGGPGSSRARAQRQSEGRRRLAGAAAVGVRAAGVRWSGQRRIRPSPYIAMP